MGEQISIEWRAFLLRLEPKATDRAEFVEYTKSWLRPASMEPKATFQIWSSDSPPPTSSLPAQVAAKTMERYEPAKVFDYHRALLRAYFTDNRDISDNDVLADIAAECDVERAGFGSALVEHNVTMTQAVIEDHNSAIQSGVTAVPTVLINNVMPVPGAQDVDTYEAWISRIRART